MHFTTPGMAKASWVSMLLILWLCGYATNSLMFFDFTVMLSCVGAGAIAAAFWFPRWRERFGGASVSP